MHKIEEDTLKQALKPYDIVRFPDGEIAFIQEVSVNNCQVTPLHQISYSIEFITENKAQHHNAWYKANEFEVLCNMFVLIAQASTSNQGRNAQWVEKLLVNK